MEPENTNNDFLALPENLKLNGMKFFLVVGFLKYIPF